MPASIASTINERIRKTVQEHARLSTDIRTLSDFDDLYQAGMTSHATVSLMLALENEFDIELPDSMLSRAMFENIHSITNVITTLQPS